VKNDDETAEFLVKAILGPAVCLLFGWIYSHFL
jgi:hypothetical protein